MNLKMTQTVTWTYIWLRDTSYVMVTLDMPVISEVLWILNWPIEVCLHPQRRLVLSRLVVTILSMFLPFFLILFYYTLRVPTFLLFFFIWVSPSFGWICRENATQGETTRPSSLCMTDPPPPRSLATLLPCKPTMASLSSAVKKRLKYLLVISPRKWRSYILTKSSSPYQGWLLTL